MSSSESNSNLSFKFDDDSEYNYIPGIYLDFEKEKGETTMICLVIMQRQISL